MLTEIDKNIWCIEQPLTFFQLEFGTRMTVIRLESGRLLIHSPIKISKTLAKEIETLGEVAYIVSPNKLHHLYLEDAAAYWPKALIFASPGLTSKRKDINFAAELEAGEDYPWSPEVRHTVFAGSAVMEEVVFYHCKSRSLIVADLLMNFNERSSWGIRIVTRIVGMFGKPTMPPDWRFSVFNKQKATAVCHQIFEWNWQRIIVAHGEIITDEPRKKFKSALSRFL